MTTIADARFQVIAGKVLIHARCAGSPGFTMTLELEERATAVRFLTGLAEAVAQLPAPTPVVAQTEGAPPKITPNLESGKAGNGGE